MYSARGAHVLDDDGDEDAGGFFGLRQNQERNGDVFVRQVHKLPKLIQLVRGRLTTEAVVISWGYELGTMVKCVIMRGDWLSICFALLGYNMLDRFRPL